MLSVIVFPKISPKRYYENRRSESEKLAVSDSDLPPSVQFAMPKLRKNPEKKDSYRVINAREGSRTHTSKAETGT